MKLLFRTKLILGAAITTLLMAGNLWAAEITVLSPANNTFVESEQLNVVIALPGGAATTVRVLAGGKSYEKKVRKYADKELACVAVTLSKGMNVVEITALNGSGTIAKSGLNIYLRSALLKPQQNPPAGFKRFYFHEPPNEELCVSCHRMEPTLYDLKPEKLEDTPCYQCHKSKGKGAYSHKPVSEGICLSCHELSKGKRKYATRKPDQDSCFICHSSQGKLWKSKQIHHGPTAVGNCTLCHNPHGSDWPSFIYMHPTDLCINCHEGKKSGLHVIAGFFGKGHPVKGASNPLKPDRQFSCAGCHNPHAGQTQSLLNQDRSNSAIYCQACHKL